MKKSIDVFISSTQIELECEREIAKDTVEYLKLNGFLFELSPALSSTPDSAYIEKVDDCEIYVLILWKRYSIAVFKEYERAVFKNKPILIFVKETREGEEREEKLLIFINKLKQGSHNENIRITKYIEFRSLKKLRESLTESIKKQIEKFFDEPFTTQSRDEMYSMGSRIISNTQKELYIFQRTPTLFFGLKDRQLTGTYLRNYERYEENFQKTLCAWIEDHRKINDVKFYYLFDFAKSKEEINSMPNNKARNELITHLKKQLNFYKKIERETKYNFKFNFTDKPISGPLIVGDNIFGIWITGLRENDSIAFSHDNAKISSILAKIIEQHMERSKTAEEMFLMLT